MKLEGVERTMLLPLWGRWSESIKPAGLIKDAQCEAMVTKSGLDFAETAATQNPASRLAWVARAWNIDRELELWRREQQLGPDAAATVIVLGCGLDTAWYRNRHLMPAATRWYDVDLDAVIKARMDLVEPDDHCVMVAGSVLESGTWDKITVQGPVLVLAVGLLYYLEATAVAELFGRIAAKVPGATVLIDYCSPRGVAVTNRKVIQNCQGTRAIWAARNGRQIQSLHPAIVRVETWPLFRLIRPRLNRGQRRLALISDLLRIMSFARLQLRATPPT